MDYLWYGGPLYRLWTEDLVSIFPFCVHSVQQMWMGNAFVHFSPVSLRLQKTPVFTNNLTMWWCVVSIWRSQIKIYTSLPFTFLVKRQSLAKEPYSSEGPGSLKEASARMPACSQACCSGEGSAILELPLQEVISSQERSSYVKFTKCLRKMNKIICFWGNSAHRRICKNKQMENNLNLPPSTKTFKNDYIYYSWGDKGIGNKIGKTA